MSDHPAEHRVGGEEDTSGPRATEPASPGPPRLPDVLLDPRPVVAAGCVAWAVATAVIAILAGADSNLLPICYAGLVTGALGTVVFLIQRRGARSGRKGAQQGLG